MAPEDIDKEINKKADTVTLNQNVSTLGGDIRKAYSDSVVETTRQVGELRGAMEATFTGVAQELDKKNVSTEVINARFLKPLDEEILIKSIEKTKNVITIEDGILKNGLGTSIIELTSKKNIRNIKIEAFGYDDCFVKQGKTEEIEKKYNLDKDSICNKILNG